MPLWSASLAATLGGCGFHLQGSEPLPRSIALVRIDTSDTESDFYFDLRKALLAAGRRPSSTC
jgi:outer membrane lipopolysaccharide assembly protein LptE/RlpB